MHVVDIDSKIYLGLGLHKSDILLNIRVCYFVRDSISGGIPVYVYQPKSSDPESDAIPILVYFHGGGSIMGSRDHVDDTCKMLSRSVCINLLQSEIVIVNWLIQMKTTIAVF